MLLLFSVSLSPANRAFLAPVACEEGPTEEVYAVARVVWSEARNQPEIGQRMIVQVIRNRAEKYNESILETVTHGMVSKGRLDPKIVGLVEDEMGGDVCCHFKFWINFERATDGRQIKLARQSESLNTGLQISDHFFY